MSTPVDRSSGEGADPDTASDSPRQHNLRPSMGYEPIERIQANPRDPRVYDRAERRRIARALRHFGALPLILNPDRVILSGNIWLEAARLAGFTEVPVFVVEHLNAADAD